MDLSKVVKKETSEVEIYYPNGELADGFKITVYSPDSKHFQKLKHARLNAKFKEKRSKKMSAEEMEENKIDLLVDATAGWSGLVDDGKTVKFDASKAKELYTEHTWIANQVGNALDYYDNFLEYAPKS